jgi:hypothetical protein
MLRRDDLRAIALSACVLALALGIWILADGIKFPQPDVGAPDLGPKLVIVGCAIIALSFAGIAVTVMAFRNAEPLSNADALERRPDLDLTRGSRPAE